MSTGRRLSFEDVLRYAGRIEAEAHSGLDGPVGSTCGGSGETAPCAGCGGTGAGPIDTQVDQRDGDLGRFPPEEDQLPPSTVFDKPVDRRRALGMLFGAVAVGSQAAGACAPLAGSEQEREAALLEWEEFFKGNFRLMSDPEKAETIERLERLAKLRSGVDVQVRATDAPADVMFGYAFNISKCKGYRSCVEACINENNLDRATGTQYIRIFEMENGEIDLLEADATFQHQVPAEGHFYLGTQCFQCANPPCVQVCPVGATWQEPDGITVIDYDWCIGCRYCQAACPYWARRFNWSEPEVPAEEINPSQHYLGNRARRKGVVEKCTFCIQRSREGRLPACAEACPTGARVFGNLLDPASEIRWVLENKRVFRLKEELGTEPRFWYFVD